MPNITGPELEISIHALREEGDFVPNRLLKPCLEFLSTPSARRATAPAMPCWLLLLLFLSTPSARRATHNSKSSGLTLIFLSTPSARRATKSVL